jgi:putative zinc finger/helix-turn-helix YgiT family protein
MSSQRKCPTCGAVGTFREGTTEFTSTVGPRVFVAALPALVCGDCNEAIFTSATVEAFERARARALASEGASDGAALRWVRKAAGLTGVELARLLGVAPETVSRWEHDVQPPDRAAVALIGALALEAMDGHSETRTRLDAMASAPARLAGGEPSRVVLRVLPSAA